MANAIKYNTSSETLALKKGNFYIGTGDVGKGPTSTTGYYNGITPPSGGYTIYLNKVSGGPSIYTCANDTELISLTNSIAGTSYTTANECLVYFAGQTDKVVLNRDYEGVVTDSLVLNLDAGFTPSYPKNVTTWYDVSVNTNNGTLTNGPTFSTDGGGSISFDGVNDFVSLGDISLFDFTNGILTVESIIKFPSSWTAGSQYPNLISKGATAGWDTNGWALFGFRDWPNSGNKSWGFGMRNGATPQYAYRANCATNVYLHVVATIDGTNIKLYENGNLYTTVSQTINPADNNTNVYIGRDASTQYFPGDMAIGRIYNRVLSASEVLQNFNAQKGRFGL